MAFSPAIVRCDRHSDAGSPAKAYAGPTRFICWVCRRGVWGSLPGGLGPRATGDSEEYIWTTQAISHAYVVLAAADHRAGIQFLFAFRQPDVTANRITDVSASTSVGRFRISAGR